MTPRVLIAAIAIAALPGLALAQGNGQGNGERNGQGSPQARTFQPRTAGPHPQHGRVAGGGLFPRNEPVPEYQTGANNPDASLTTGSAIAPNAGNTGLTGSSGSNVGWPAPSGRMRR